EAHRLCKFEHTLTRGWEENVESFDVRVVAPLAELTQNPFGIVLIVWRADMVRVRGDAAHVLALLIGCRNGAKADFPFPFGGGAAGCVAIERGDVGGRGVEQQTNEQGRHCCLPQVKQSASARTQSGPPTAGCAERTYWR